MIDPELAADAIESVDGSTIEPAKEFVKLRTWNVSAEQIDKKIEEVTNVEKE